MTKIQFYRLFHAVLDSSDGNYEKAYELAESIHIAKYGERKYKNYQVFRVVKSRIQRDLRAINNIH